jgi:hypothetical protein
MRQSLRAGDPFRDRGVGAMRWGAGVQVGALVARWLAWGRLPHPARYGRSLGRCPLRAMELVKSVLP